MDYGRGELVEFRDLVEELLALTEVDARRLGITEEVSHIRNIAKEGTSGRRQLDVHHRALEGGASNREALEEVVDHVIVDTMAGLWAGPRFETQRRRVVAGRVTASIPP